MKKIDQPCKNPPVFKTVNEDNSKFQFSNAHLQEKSSVQNETCPICLNYQCNIKTRCGHRYCKKCITDTLKIKNNCPLCRRHNPMGDSDPDSQKISNQQWNIDVVRRAIIKKVGQNEKQVFLQNEGNLQPTSIRLINNPRIQVSPEAKIIINGKKVNSSDCNTQ